MVVNFHNSTSSLLSVAQQYTASTRVVQPQSRTESNKTEVDTFTRSASDFSMPNGVYDMSGVISGGIPPVAPSGGSSDTSDLMSRMSSAFRANQDVIKSAMSELGLTEEDLREAENLTALANKLNDGAAELGLPQIEDIDAAVEEVLNGTSAGSIAPVSSDGEIPEAPDGKEPPKGTPPSGGPGGPGGAGGPSGAGSSESSDDEDEDEDSTTSTIVNELGLSYIETQRTENGVTTTTRTMLGSIGSTKPGGVSSFGGMPQVQGFSGMNGMGAFNAMNFAMNMR